MHLRTYPLQFVLFARGQAEGLRGFLCLFLEFTWVGRPRKQLSRFGDGDCRTSAGTCPQIGASRHIRASPEARHQSSGTELLKLLYLGIPAAYVKFFARLLNFALSPDASQPMLAAFSCCAREQGAWVWISPQVRGNLAGPEWARPVLLEAVNTVYVRVLRRLARRHRPLFRASSTIAELHEIRGSLCARPMGGSALPRPWRPKWILLPLVVVPLGSMGPCRLIWVGIFTKWSPWPSGRVFGRGLS